MKEKIVSKLKKVFTQSNKKRIKITVGSILFVFGFFAFFEIFQRPIPDVQFNLCEHVAQVVAENLPTSVKQGDFWMDVTDNFSVKVTLKNDSVEVTPSDNYFYRSDTAIAKFKDGTLVLERRDGTPISIMLSTLFGFMCFILGLILINKIYITLAEPNVTE